MILSVLPAWFPSDAVAVFLVALIVAIVLMNRGAWWVVNLLAQDEPLLVAVGVTVAAAHGEVSRVVGAGSPDAWLVVGVATALLGVVVWRSDDLDLRGPL